MKHLLSLFAICVISLAGSCQTVHNAAYSRVNIQTVPRDLDLYYQGRKVNLAPGQLLEVSNFIAEDYVITMRKGEQYVGAREMSRTIKPPMFAVGVLTIVPLLWSYGANEEQLFDMSAYLDSGKQPAAGPGFRDEVVLKDGRRFPRVRAAVTESSIVITMENGEQLVIAKSQVARIVRGD